jgi:hypothetical protein
MSLSGNRVPKKIAPENRRPIFGGKTMTTGKPNVQSHHQTFSQRMLLGMALHEGSVNHMLQKSGCCV